MLDGLRGIGEMNIPVSLYISSSYIDLFFIPTLPGEFVNTFEPPHGVGRMHMKKRMQQRKRQAQREQRCVCGQPITHPPIPPGVPWPGNLYAPPEVIAAGHRAHPPDEYCGCAVCISLR